MKRYLIILLLFYSNTVRCQLYDNIWPLGYSPHTEVNFINGVFDTSSSTYMFDFFLSNSSMSDSAGNLIYYTNGIYVANRNHDTLLNSNNFNTGWGQSFYANGGLGYVQSLISLPKPGSNSNYFIFYCSNEHFFSSPSPTGPYQNLQPFRLKFSEIDMSLDNGLGGIKSGRKAKTIILDTLYLGRLSATRHGNGRDWWIVCRKFNSNGYYVSHLCDTGIRTTSLQYIGLSEGAADSTVDFDAIGQAAFSPDGSKYLMVGPSNIINVFDFDRCSGTFFNARVINFTDFNYRATGCSFSPNSKYIYINSLIQLFQYNTDFNNLDSTQTLIADRDSFPFGGIPTLFGINQLGPDNKIYLGTLNGTRYLHVINQPDSSSSSCDFQQHEKILPWFTNSVPSFPNFKLGALFGSMCDTITALPEFRDSNIKIEVYPNPTSGQVTFRIADDIQIKNIQISNMVGSTNNFHFQNNNLDISLLSSGIYTLRLETNRGNFIRKIVKL